MINTVGRARIQEVDDLERFKIKYYIQVTEDICKRAFELKEKNFDRIFQIAFLLKKNNDFHEDIFKDNMLHYIKENKDQFFWKEAATRLNISFMSFQEKTLKETTLRGEKIKKRPIHSRYIFNNLFYIYTDYGLCKTVYEDNTTKEIKKEDMIIDWQLHANLTFHQSLSEQFKRNSEFFNAKIIFDLATPSFFNQSQAS